MMKRVQDIIWIGFSLQSLVVTLAFQSKVPHTGQRRQQQQQQVSEIGYDCEQKYNNIPNHCSNHPNQLQRYHQSLSPLYSKPSSSSEPEEFYDDGIGEVTGNGDFNDYILFQQKNINDGDALAKEFFRQQREREQKQISQQGKSSSEKDVRSSSSSSLEEETYSTTNKSNSQPQQQQPKRQQNNSVDMRRGLFEEPPESNDNNNNNNNMGPTSRKKFTGRRDLAGEQQPGRMMSSSPEQQMFGRSRSTGGSGGGGGQTRSPREVMMEREYQLVSRAERGLGIQAIIAVLALVFYIYIGASGGIVTGDAAISDSFGGDDSIYFEQLMPVQRDSETSVWL